MKISVLHSQQYSPNEICFLYPLHRFRNAFKQQYDIRLDFSSAIDKTSSDICLISSKWFSRWWIDFGSAAIFKQLEALKKRHRKLIWCDISDSTGTTHFKVLPYVDLYFKNQVFLNKKDYLRTYYGSRIYSDFIHHHFGIRDHTPDEPHLNEIPEVELLSKIQVSWNSGFAYFGMKKQLQQYLFSKYPKTLKYFKHRWILPDINRTIPISCRLGTKYSRETISQSRKMILDQLKGQIATNKISYRQYYQELSQSISAMTPFGLGEISLRDFEIVMNGVAMIKQDMSHLETWPNLWVSGNTYLNFSWDLSDLNEKIAFAKSHPEIMLNYASEAQKIYKNILDSDQSESIFCERFNLLVGK